MGKHLLGVINNTVCGDSLEAHETSDLRAHLNECPFCRKILFNQVAQRIYNLPQIFSREELRE